MDFLQLGVSESITKKLKENGIYQPTTIQQQAIPVIIDGTDVIAQAQTGTGKTLAFLLPILEKITKHSTSIQALIVTPTRELALQISEETNKLIADIEGIEALAVYGGQDVDKQLKRLQKHVQMVIGTPGRLLDHIRRKTILLDELSFLVLDEADQMLQIGFFDEVEEIIKQTPKTRQTLLFSATIPSEIRKLAEKYMIEPQYLQIEKKQGPALTVKQIAIHTTDRAKQATFIQLVEMYRPYVAVVFCRTKRRVTKLFDALKAHGFLCDELHGDLSQSKREQVMKRFRTGEIQLLIATDVAARGLDVEGVTHVFNYDIPLDAESYVHRIGRTGRAGMKGFAITLYSSRDRLLLEKIEKDLSIRIAKQNIEKSESNKGKEKESKSQEVKRRTEKDRSTYQGEMKGQKKGRRGRANSKFQHNGNKKESRPKGRKKQN